MMNCYLSLLYLSEMFESISFFMGEHMNLQREIARIKNNFGAHSSYPVV